MYVISLGHSSLTYANTWHPNAVGEAIGLELRTRGNRPYLHTQLFTGFMYIGASLCVVLLRIWKARSAGKSQEAKASPVPDSTGQPDCEGRVSGGANNSDAYFKVGKVRLWKQV